MQNARVPPDYDGAVEYALQLLHTKLPRALTYHCAAHTEHDVLPAVSRLARLSHVTAEEMQELRVAAAYHDLGYIRSIIDHEAIGVAILSERLPRHGFTEDAIARIASIVEATRMPQSPRNQLGSLMADADLDSLGREDFLKISAALWRERNVLGCASDWLTWLERQLRFMQSHNYFTPAAQALRNAGKQKNIELLRAMLESAGQ